MSSEPFLWWRDGIIYQIYPRSFSDSNGDGIGDLWGIITKLDYLADLGIDAIWLSPIYPSPDIDFGYDVSNYLDVSPLFGSLADLDRLVKEAHQRKIRIVLDLVLNHTSDQHPWFQSSRMSRDNPYSDWYLWQDAKPGQLPNNWESVFGGRGWEWDCQRQQYYFHMFYKQQPDLNWQNPQVRQEMLNVFRFWLERGIDGFRLDVFNAYFKRADFPDNPPKFGLRGFDRQQHLYDFNQPEMLPLLSEIRDTLNDFDERYVVGETFESPPNVAAAYCGSDRLHAAFNFALLHCGWNPKQFMRETIRWEQVLGSRAWPCQVLNNHDNPRSTSRYIWSENDAKAKVAAAMLLTLRGTPYLYYGEEIGMRDIPRKREEILDPIGKRYWPFHKGRDGCRSPMQWTDGENGGFSTGKPWLPAHANYKKRNVEQQRQDPNSLFNFYRRLIQIRKQSPALMHGAFIPLGEQSDFVMAYLRQSEDETILVALNFSRLTQKIVIDEACCGRKWKGLLSESHEKEINGRQLELAPYEVCLFKAC